MITPTILIDGSPDDSLVPLSVERVMAPGINKVVLQRRTGLVNGTQAPYNTGELETIAYQDHREKTVQISLEDHNSQTDEFTAVIIQDSQRIAGVNENNIRSSVDTYTAFGFEYYLSKNTIESSLVYGDVTIGRALPFNLVTDSGERVGNKSHAASPLSFADEIEDQNQEWTGLSIVQYLLEQFDTHFGWTFTLGGDSSIINALAEIRGNWSAEGKTYWQLINEIINPRYGFCFYVDMGLSGHELVVKTVVSEAVVNLPANDTTVTVDLGSSHRHNNVNLNFIDDSYFGKLIVKGGRHILTNTFTYAEFDEVWTSDDLDEYNDPATTDEQRKELKKEGIFTKFHMKPPASWTTPGEIDSVKAFPVINSDGTVDNGNSSNINYPVFKFLSNLAVTKDRQAHQPFAFMDTLDDPAVTERIDNPTNGSGIDLYVLADKPGIQFRPRIPHLIGGTEFDSENAESDIEPVFDYKTMKVTLSYLADEHLKIESVIDANVDKTKIINVPDLKVSAVLENTILPEGTQEATEVRENGAPELQKISDLAKAWYGKRKSSLSWTYPDGEIREALGYLITTAAIGETNYQINTIVSRVIYNFRIGTNGGTSTQLSTEFKDIDIQSIVRKNRNSSVEQTSSDIVSLKQKVANIPARPALKAPGGGGGGGRTLVMLTGNSVSTEQNEWKGTEITDRVTKTPITENITIVAPQATYVTLPITGDDPKRFWRADKIENPAGDQIADANDAMADPPKYIYEIQPNTWN